MPAKRSRKPAAASRRAARSGARRGVRRGAPASNGARNRRRGVAPRRPARVSEFSELLLEERKRLRDELAVMEGHQAKTEEKPIADAASEDDLVDVASEAFEREKELALESTVQGMLEMVEAALQKVRKGTYGVCEGCERPIDTDRLRAIPYARLCIKCKEREEQRRPVPR